MEFSEELGNLLTAFDSLRRLARAESKALEVAERLLTANAVAFIRETHLAELDALQALVAHVDLFRKRHPELRSSSRDAVDEPTRS